MVPMMTPRMEGNQCCACVRSLGTRKSEKSTVQRASRRIIASLTVSLDTKFVKIASFAKHAQVALIHVEDTLLLPFFALD